ncbi:MAG TPA: toll/interleukin-1 receptor domain-containing protein [Pseudonocardiaceae bacterium]|nr:toll/interleukin-1 receptor domain-containing protein [Pseudonocardiaceae bacterium]
MDAAEGDGAIVNRLVFVSHGAKDTWVARQIARRIVECGAVPFLAEADVAVGADFEDEILTFLRQADELVALLTPSSLERPYVWAELGVAWGRRIPIVVLLWGLSAGELQGRPEVPVFIKQRDSVLLNDVDQYFEQLRSRVQAQAGAGVAK